MECFDKLSEYGNRIAAIDDNNQKVTYEQLQMVSKEIGTIIPERALVFSLCENSVGPLIGYVACQINHIVPLLLNKHIDSEQLLMLIKSYEPQYIFLPDDMRDKFREYQCIWENYHYCILKTDYISSALLYPELALLLSTSGSTGSPKLVRQSYKNVFSNASAISAYLELNELEKPITTLPMNYTYGLSIINSHLLTGACIIMTNRSLMEKEFWAIFKEQEATSFGGVPYTYEILKKLRFQRMDLPSLRTMTQAGGKLSPQLHKEFAEYALEKGIHFIVMYGQTEATARMSYLPHDKALIKYGSMGIAIPGGKFSLIDAEENIISESNIVGELVYEGENVTLGYAECREDLQKGDERNGVLFTGDMAKKDDDGYYYIVGRKKRFLKIYGNRVNLDEVERMLATAYPDMEFACIGVDDHMQIFMTRCGEQQCDVIRDFVAERTGLNRIAFEVRKIDEIPKNDSGKKLYSELADK